MATPPPSKLAVVTGASSGIGLELARNFAVRGYDLLIAAEDDGIEGVARTIGGGVSVEPVQVDLATPEGVEELYRRIQAAGRPVDAIALNAGIGAGARSPTAPRPPTSTRSCS